MAKKAELQKQAEDLGIDPEGLTVEELEEAIAAEEAQMEEEKEVPAAEADESTAETVPAPVEANVKAENRGGAITLVFGSHVPDEEEAGFNETASFVISRDEAVQLAQDLPVVAQDATATAVHSG